MILAPHQAGDPRFFGRTGLHPLAAIAAAAKGGLSGSAVEAALHGVAPQQAAGSSELSFSDNRKHVDALAYTLACAAVVRSDLAARPE